MADLRELAHPGIKYSTFVLNDGKTFVHIGMYAGQEALDVVNNLPSFQSFREQLKASGPEAPPKGDDLTLVDSSYEIFWGSIFSSFNHRAENFTTYRVVQRKQNEFNRGIFESNQYSIQDTFELVFGMDNSMEPRFLGDRMQIAKSGNCWHGANKTH